MILLLSLLACTGETGETEEKLDVDGDGLLATVDCDDTDATVGLPVPWYGDGDADGFGNATISVEDCTAPSGFVDNADDCDDGDVLISPAGVEHCDGVDEDCDGDVDEEAVDFSTFHADADGDGYGDPDSGILACEAPSDTVADGTDCDDSLADVSPVGTEHCDGVDEDCDGAVDDDPVDGSVFYEDQDGDGWGGAVWRACTQPSGAVTEPGDCDDAAAARFPGADELCNGADDNCDGTVDEDSAVDSTAFYADSDGDGYGDATVVHVACAAGAGEVADATDCDDGAATTYPTAAEHCDGVDEDCDGSVDEEAVDFTTFYADADGDGFGSASASLPACSLPAGYTTDLQDCDDSSAAVSPTATELCNSIDDDCDGSTDENDAADAPLWYTDADGDGYGDDSSAAPSCTQPSGTVAVGGDCADTDAAHSPATAEHCDGVDENCNSIVDDSPVDGTAYYLDGDGDGYGDTTTLDTACTPPSGSRAVGGDCDDSSAGVAPGATEHCDGVDEDCDGTVDNAAVDMLTWYVDADGDQYGDPAGPLLSCSRPVGFVADNTDCDDSNASYNTSCRVGCTTITPYRGSVYASGFGSATSLASFCSAYNAISGDLTLDRTDLSSMAVFSCLCEVGGDVSITGNTALSSLGGLERLGTVGGDVSIENNDLLPDYTGLSSLETITGTLTVGTGNALITDMVGFDTLTSVGNLDISNTGLTSLDGLESLETVVGDFTLSGNESLISVEGLSGLTSVGGELYIYNNDLLPSLTGVEQLSSVGGTLSVYGVDGIPDLHPFSGLRSLGGLYVSACDLNTDLSGLEGLTSISGSVSVLSNNVQTSLTGLENVTDIGGDLYVNSVNLTSLQGLNGLTHVGGDFTFYSGIVTDLQGLNALQSIDGTVELVGPFSSMQGLDALSTIGGYFFVQTSNSGATFVGAETLTSVGSSVDWYGMGSLQGLSGLSSIGGTLRVSGPTDYTGLSSLTTVGGNVSSLNSTCNGLSALQTIGGTLNLVYDTGAGLPALRNLGALSASASDPTGLPITAVTGDVLISYPQTLTGLNSLQTIGGNFRITTNYGYSPITVISGMTGLQTVGGNFTIDTLDYLTTISGFSSLNTVGGELFLTSTRLSAIPGFTNLRSVGGLRLWSTMLPNLGVLSGLTTINGDLDLSFNALLVNVTGLYSVRSVTGDVYIGYNGINNADANNLINSIGLANIGGSVTNAE